MSKRVLIVDDEKCFRELYSQTLETLNVNILTAESGEKALQIINEILPDIVISDVRMGELDGINLLKEVKAVYPELPFLMVTAFASIRDAVSSLKYGAIDYLEKPVDLDELKAAVSDVLNIKTTLPEFDLPKNTLKSIVAESPEMLTLLCDAYRVAKSDISVLITGESGTGKEVISQFIHDNSNRADKDLVALNCASISANMLNSELFGHVKGAFTGAVSARSGKFREADKSTLFLDEIGDMPSELQPALLRALETGKISPLGVDKDIRVDVRLIAATNRELEKEIEEGNFREDLFYRLNVINLTIPPLRKRKDDIIPLARNFLNPEGALHKRLSATTIRILESYNWPGNVRELSNVMKRARLLSRTEIVMPEHLPPNIRNTKIVNEVQGSADVKTIEELEKNAILDALNKTNGNQTKASQLLGISRRTLINKIKKY